MRFLVAVGYLHRFVQLAFLESAGNPRSKLARLLASRAEVECAVDDHSQRPDRHNEQDRDDGLSRGTHVVPEVHGGEADGLP